MRDVAKKAGVSQSTVSRVLHPKSTSIPISEETIARVYEATEKLGYRFEAEKPGRQRAKTHLIAFMIPDITNPFYQTMIHVVQQVAHAHQYDLILAATEHKAEYENRFVEAMIRYPVDGIILASLHITYSDLDRLSRYTGTHLVTLGMQYNHPNVDVLQTDDEYITYKTVRWLIQQKQHQRIGFIHVLNNHASDSRKQGYERALRDSRLTPAPGYIQYGNWTVESGEQALKNLLLLPNPPTALFAGNDQMALGVLKYALELKIRIPQELAIVGFDNIPTTTLVNPKLTTIDQHHSEMGMIMAQALFERIEGLYQGPSRTLSCRIDLIERETT